MKSTKIRIMTWITVLVLAQALIGCGQATPTPESVSVEPTSTPPPTQTPTRLPTQPPTLALTSLPALTPTPALTSTSPPALTPTPEPMPTRPPTPTPTPTATRQPLVSPDDVEINPAYGTVEARFTGNAGQFIVLIGENHASYKVQQNVGRIAEQLLSEYDIRLLLIEGYGEDIDTSFFDAIPDPAIRREVAWAFLETHEISGIEYAALIGGPDVKTIGIENMDLWQQSKTAVDSEPDVEDPEVQQAWEALIEQVIALIEQLEYTAELDKMTADFVDDKVSFVEFHDYLLETAAEESVSTAELEAAYQELEEALNPVLKFATEREPPMVDNSLAAMEQYGADVAILLVGHAHFVSDSEEGGLSALLQARGVSYVYVLPDGTEDETTDEENQYYEDQLNEVPSAFEAWLNSLFKPKPSLSRPNRRAEVELIGKVAAFESLAQAGKSWDEIAADHADWLASGDILIQNRFDVSGKFSVYPCRAKGIETFALAVSASASEPKVSHEDDVIERWQMGDRWVTAIKGRSADILIRRGIVARHSEPGRTFAYVYEINDGEGIAWQVGDAEIVVPDISWDALNILLDPEMPIEGREEKIKTALGGSAGEPPLGGDDGPIIIFPEDPDYVPGAEGGDDYDAGRYFHPSYGDEWTLDWTALTILLGRQLDRIVHKDGNPVLAKENLDRQEPVSVENMGVVVDEASLNDEQKKHARQIPEAIENAGVALENVQLSFSLDDFPLTSNVLFITAENDKELVERLTRLGKANLRDKYIVLLTCGEEGLRDFADWVVQEYELTGLHVYRDKIHASTLPVIVGELYRLAQEEPGLAPAELIDQAVKRALEKAIERELEQNLNRFRNGWNQLSRQLDLHSEDVLVAQMQLAVGLLG